MLMKAWRSGRASKCVGDDAVIGIMKFAAAAAAAVTELSLVVLWGAYWMTLILVASKR